jgi:hypothetical protein
MVQLKMYRAPNFPRCFLFRLQMKKTEKKTRRNEIPNKNDTKKERKIEEKKNGVLKVGAVPQMKDKHG